MNNPFSVWLNRHKRPLLNVARNAESLLESKDTVATCFRRARDTIFSSPDEWNHTFWREPKTPFFRVPCRSSICKYHLRVIHSDHVRQQLTIFSSKCTICAFATESCRILPLRWSNTNWVRSTQRHKTQTEVVEEKCKRDTKGKFRFIKFC